jgi:hypothetical protein
MLESALWASLKKSEQIPFTVRVESSVTPGLPDLYFAFQSGITGWVELKSVKDSVQRPLKVLRPLQILWIKKSTKMNILTYVLLFYKGRGILLSGLIVPKILEETEEAILKHAIWVGDESPKKRWNNIALKLEQHGEEIIQLARKSNTRI